MSVIFLRHKEPTNGSLRADEEASHQKPKARPPNREQKLSTVDEHFPSQIDIINNMRHGRAKASRRTLQFYRLNAPHLKSPYKILLDGTFLVASIRNKVPLWDRFSKTLQHEQFVCYVTRSTLNELELLSQRSAKSKQLGDSEESSSTLFDQARQYGLDECEIIENYKEVTNANNEKLMNKRAFRDFSEASRDIFCLATDGGNNRHAYFVATQDDGLSDALRAMP